LKRYARNLVLPALLLAVALILASCGGSGSTQQETESGSAQEETQETTGGMAEMDHDSTDTGSGETAPAMLVQNGEYSDERFIDMMIPHHMMAVDMANVAQKNTAHAEIQQLAGSIVSAQEQEIEEMKTIKEEQFGSSETPTMMNPEEMDNMVMSMPDELENQQPFDKAFIDSMMPHHSSAIEMASVALKRSDNSDIQRIARGIINGQAEEIGQMNQWRQEWYSEG
jgi:uncharacterized protein (DUF305 family)